ncbi:hypothetical protein ACIQU5_03530 [Streptomyces sp. NPDC090306]|uniref:hypothetical protein n=1 Tax=unclassified Streptomyces TaxID=2593676 RepID=UPI0036F153AC
MKKEPTARLLRTEQLLSAAGVRLREAAAPADVGAGLRRLAEDAGYVPRPASRPDVSRARHRLRVIVRWCLDQPDASVHVERLAQAIGGDHEDVRHLLQKDRDTEDIDVHGAQVFACMLYLADHPESAQFWWQFTAGAGSGAGAFCLHMHHASRGETAEADHWLDIMLRLVHIDEDPAVERLFFAAAGDFAAYVRHHRPPALLAERRLAAEVRRLASRGDAAHLVCRPDRALADRLHSGAPRG